MHIYSYWRPPESRPGLLHAINKSFLLSSCSHLSSRLFHTFTPSNLFPFSLSTILAYFKKPCEFGFSSLYLLLYSLSPLFCCYSPLFCAAWTSMSIFLVILLCYVIHDPVSILMCFVHWFGDWHLIITRLTYCRPFIKRSQIIIWGSSYIGYELYIMDIKILMTFLLFFWKQILGFQPICPYFNYALLLCYIL